MHLPMTPARWATYVEARDRMVRTSAVNLGRRYLYRGPRGYLYITITRKPKGWTPLAFAIRGFLRELT